MAYVKHADHLLINFRHRLKSSDLASDTESALPPSPAPLFGGHGGDWSRLLCGGWGWGSLRSYGFSRQVFRPPDWFTWSGGACRTRSYQPGTLHGCCPSAGQSGSDPAAAALRKTLADWTEISCQQRSVSFTHVHVTVRTLSGLTRQDLAP